VIPGDPAGAQAIGIDAGATKTAAARVRADGTVAASARRDTLHGTAEGFAGMLAGLVAELRTERVVGVGVGLPGMVHRETGALAFAPALDFGGAPVRAMLASRLDLPVATNNDANAAAWAEYRMGSGQGHDDMLLITIGTGLGGGIVSGGRLLRGAHGYAAEVSHLVIEPDGPPCACGARGCWGVAASGHRIAALGREAVARDPGSLIARMAGGDAAAAAGEHVTAAARLGDEAALEILRHVGALTGRGIAALVNIFDPTIAVVGGGGGETGDLLLEPARQSFRRWVYAAPHRPDVPLVAARLGNLAGAVGAALLALDEFAT
jgi:glucokinase